MICFGNHNHIVEWDPRSFGPLPKREFFDFPVSGLSDVVHSMHGDTADPSPFFLHFILADSFRVQNSPLPNNILQAMTHLQRLCRHVSSLPEGYRRTPLTAQVSKGY